MCKLFIPIIVWMMVFGTACGPIFDVGISKSKVIVVDTSWDKLIDTNYLRMLTPYKTFMEHTMSKQIGYAKVNLTTGKPESPMSNWSSDALLTIARKEYKHPVDIAIVNMGGLRCEWNKGPITLQNVYELMPFDNELVVLTMMGKDILTLCDHIAQQGGQGVAGLRMQIKKGKAVNVTINKKKVIPNKKYYVATSDYLSTGNDHLEPLANHTNIWCSHKKIRELYRDYIISQKVISAKKDGRIKNYTVSKSTLKKKKKQPMVKKNTRAVHVKPQKVKIL